MTRLLPGAALLALVLLAFTAGWWIGRTTRHDLAAEVARLEEKLEASRRAAPAPPAPGATPAGVSGAAPGPESQQVYAVDIGGSPALGPDNAPVTIVEFSDFQCPFCASAFPTLQRILAEYRGKVRLVFKHNPLPIHKNGLLAHRAAAAAQRQGKFWEMHDLLFASQDTLDRETIKAHARALDLDLKAFEEFLSSPESTQVVSADMSQAGRLGIAGVPSFFINGRFLAGAQPFEVFQESIERELRSKG
jgi:protein-disulfide isomerase